MSLYSGLSLGKNRPTEDGGDPKSDGSGSNPGGSSAPTESQSVNSSASGWNTVFSSRNARKKPAAAPKISFQLGAPKRTAGSAFSKGTSLQPSGTNSPLSHPSRPNPSRPNTLPTEASILMDAQTLISHNQPGTAGPALTGYHPAMDKTGPKGDLSARPPFDTPTLPPGSSLLLSSSSTVARGKRNPLAGLNHDYQPHLPNHYDRCKAALARQKKEKEAKRAERRRLRRLAKHADKRPDSASEKPGLPGGDGGDRDSDSEDIRSNVVVLCNMVRPGEVDESLQQETTDECLKYGPVVKCLVYEVPGDQLPAEIAVRIFVEFEDEAAAERAKADLHSRYFDGRRVTARSFDPQRFGRYDLAPTSAEIDRVVNRRKGVSQAILENPTTTTASSTL
ncbi:hypothetical protein H4R33_006569 [Dimargaris cristalligena]|nr:hypothetical protein H4R33_006569 [Dimargaris cristalligena]